MQTTYILEADARPDHYLKGFTRATPPMPTVTEVIAESIHFPDVDTANINRDSIAEQTGVNFSVKEVNM